MSKHENYEILNLLGYALAKFDNAFVKEMGYSSKDAMYKYLVDLGVAKSVGTIKNRQDLFDPFFENERKGWWQKGDVYIHRKLLIDSFFGSLSVKEYAQMIKTRLTIDFKAQLLTQISPIFNTKFKQMQETGREAEEFFIHNFHKASLFANGTLEDARLYGDGYDFQISVNEHFYLAEVKGIRLATGAIRITENEYKKALEYKSDYILAVVTKLNEIPKLITISDPLKTLKFSKQIIKAKEQVTYNSKNITW